MVGICFLKNGISGKWMINLGIITILRRKFGTGYRPTIKSTLENIEAKERGVK